jgi:perosamine synthetase
MKYPVYIPEITQKEKDYVNQCLDSTWISSKGKFINKFESHVANQIGIKNAIAVSNGTVALHVALEAYNIGPGDEVIIPDFTYIASANAVKYTGANVVFTDVDPESWNITIEHIKNSYTEKTKAVMVTDIFGTPPEMDEIREFCTSKGIILIEDAAESLGASYKNKLAGNLGDIATFSFFGNKTITTGEGGMVLTNDDEIARKIRKLKNQGNSDIIRYYHDILGYNYRMTNIQAAIGCAQMERLDSILKRKKRIFEVYKNELDGIVSFQKIPDYITSTYWMISFTFNESLDKNLLMEKLLGDGIETRPFFIPISSMPFYNSCNTPNSLRLSNTGINVPSYPTLKEIDVKWICEQIKRRIKEQK